MEGENESRNVDVELKAEYQKVRTVHSEFIGKSLIEAG